MTKLEAIAFFKDMDECTYGSSEPIQMAIEALKQEPCEDAVSKTSVFEIMGNLMSIPYDLDRPINKKDVSDSMGEIRALPPVTPTRKERMQESVLDKIKAEIEALPKTYPFVNHFDMYVKEDDVKKIIDKYKAEMEK